MSELEDFKKKVVDVALKAAEDHDWCDVVDGLLVKKLGLQEYMPEQFIVQMLSSKRHKNWTEISDYYGNGGHFKTLKEAKEAAQDERRDYTIEPYNPRQAVLIHIDPDKSLDDLLDSVQESYKNLPQPQPWTAPEYPLLRVVSSKTGKVFYEVQDKDL